MDTSIALREQAVSYITSDTDLSQPVLIKHDDQPIGVLLSMAEYQRYQEFLASKPFISEREAQRAADRRVFGDLVGCALSSGEPIWASQPTPHWQIPYRLFDGALLKLVHVDAETGRVALTDDERTVLFVSHLLQS